jgi:hypothetical protein
MIELIKSVREGGGMDGSVLCAVGKDENSSQERGKIKKSGKTCSIVLNFPFGKSHYI